MNHRVVLGVCLLMLCLADAVLAQGRSWYRLSSDNFTLYTDTTESKGRRLLTDLEGRVAAFSQAFGDLPKRQFPIQVFVFDAESDFVQVAPAPVPDSSATNPNLPFQAMRRGPEKPDKHAYLLRGPDRLFMVAEDKSPEDIADHVGHALGHALFERYVTWRPFWLAEGVSEYIRRVGRDPETKTFSDEEGYTLQELVTIVPSGSYDDGAKATPFRMLSYRLVQFLLRENPQVLKNYFSELRQEHERLPVIKLDTEALEPGFKAYVETPVKMPAFAGAIRGEAVPASEVAIGRGDALLASGRESEAGRFYNADSPAARAARAIVIRFSRSPAEAVRVLDRAARELPENGLVQYHFGAVQTENANDLKNQAAALERALKLLPLMGRAHAELARVYALTGQAALGLPLLDRALELEPEYADRIYEVRADVHIALGDFSEAFRNIQIADLLPHRNKDEIERITLKINSVKKRIETLRREADERRFQQLRAEAAAEAARREPPRTLPPPPAPVPEGMITYEIEARAVVEVVDATFPEYPEALRKAGTTGTIALQVTVGPDGKVAAARVASSKVPALNDATVDAVKKWLFKPGNRTLRLIITYALQ